MPQLAKVLTESDLTSSRGQSRMDLTPYFGIIDAVTHQGGVGGEVMLLPDERRRTEKRRLSIAAKQRDMKLTWRKSREGMLRFVLTAPGAIPPDGRRRRQSRERG
jgi:hypothetical protein